MNDQNKDSLENFFKKGAQKYDIEFREGDWKKMEALLDSEMPVAFSLSALLKKIWPLVALLLVIPLGWYSFDRFSSDKATELGSVYHDDNIDSNPTTANDQLLESKNTNNQLVDSKTLTDSEIHTKSSENNQGLKPGFSSMWKTIDVATFTEMDKNEQVIYRNLQNESLEESFQSGDITSASSREQGTDRSESYAYRVPGMLIPLFPGSAFRNPFEPAQIEARPVVEDLGNTRYKASLTLGAGFSPDFSTVGLGNFVSPGIRWNFMAEMGVSRRLKINTGITWVKNKYEAKGEDYHAPPRYWKNGISADEAYGECIMLDIPINVRYDFLISGRHQIFISGGASTYFLLKEDYYFEYEADDPDLPQHWGTDEVSIYPFKIINLSVGYQYNLGRKGALQIEPFIKLPTAGVGWGEVDLHTLGIYFMYKYRLGK